jgi:glycosyltransferase involved in cell wall biosynthesis
MSGLLCKVNPRWFSDHMIAISRELRSQFNQHLNIPYNMISLIPNGINHHYFRHPSREERLASRKSFGIEPEVPVVCLVGRLDPVKGHQVLFRALQEIKKSSTRVHAICAGSGETFEPEIKSLATELDLQNQIIFPGHTDARRVYWASDIKVLPSYREGNPIVISEAMLCGLPTIRTPTSGARDQTVEGKTGYIVPLDAPDQLAKRVRYLFDYPEKRKEMGRAARTYAKQHFTLEATVDQTERLYCDLASAL